MTGRQKYSVAGRLLGAFGLPLLAAYTGGMLALAQTVEAPRDAAAAAQTAIDPDDRASQIWHFQRLGSRGWQRGQEIYYMRCWICHNEYTVIAEPGAAPSLRDLFRRSRLLNGQPTTDGNVKAFVRKGSFRMPSYSPEYFSDRDLDDLIVYLREKCGTFPTGGGCFDEHNPPANPQYRVK